MAIETVCSTLQDPNNVAGSPARLQKLRDKISMAMTRLVRQPENGGNPFLYALSAPKPHYLMTKIPGYNAKFTTAATDGRKYYWNPDFLEKLLDHEVPTVMEHEGYHDIFDHCRRGQGCNQRVFNWAVDYVVNAVIEASREKVLELASQNHKQINDQKVKPLWGGNLGTPLPLADLLSFLDGNMEIPSDGSLIFADKTVHGRSPESIYSEIMEHWKKSPRRCPDCGALSMNPKTGKPEPKSKKGQKGQQDSKKGQKGQQGGKEDQGKGKGNGNGNGEQGEKDGGHNCGPGQGSGHDPGQGSHECQGDPSGEGESCSTCGTEFDPLASMDAHIQSDRSRDEVMADIMRASQQTSVMRGSVPGAIQEMLGELQNPTLKFTDIVRSALLRKVQDSGMKNDWKRLRRRWLVATPKQYLPRRHTHNPRWLAMIDTSGSMSEDDINYGISQLQVLGDSTEGYVIPCDASPKWDAVQRITGKTDLKRTKIVGRGGTVFDEFFADFPKKLGVDFDVIVVITDGICGQVPIQLRPPCDVCWVITRKDGDYTPSFGRMAPLRHSRA